MAGMTKTQPRKKNTGEPGNPGQFGTQKLAEADVNLDAWDVSVAAGLTVETLHHPDGKTVEVKRFDGGDLRWHETYTTGADGDAEPAAVRHYLNGELNDTADGTAAFRTFDNGMQRIVIHMQNGKGQDPAPGVPAATVYTADGSGAEQMRTHQQNGVIQDPAPGVPAQVANLGGGMKRSVYYTQGVVWKQEDQMPLTLPGGETVIVTTTKQATE